MKSIKFYPRPKIGIFASYFFITAAIIALTIPGLAQASSFFDLDGKVVLTSNKQIYRLRQTDKPWQLVNLANSFALTDETIFQGQIFIVSSENGWQVLYHSSDGLKFDQINTQNSKVLKLKSIGGKLLVLTQTDNQYTLSSWENNQLAKLDSSQISDINDLSNIFSSNSQLLLVKKDPLVNNQKVIYLLQNSHWLPMYSLSCPDVQLIVQPTTFLFCQNRIYQLEINNFREIASQVSQYSTSADLLSALVNNSQQIVIWQNNNLITIDLTGDNSINEVTNINQRVFLQNSSSALFELDYLNVKLTLISNAFKGQVLGFDNDQQKAIFSDNNQGFYSTQAGSYQPIITVGAFNHALKTGQGLLVWQTDATLTKGGLTQYSSDFANFQKVDPWAMITSPVQAVKIGSDSSRVAVITNSGTGNLNLYETKDFIHWSRVTLPDQPTYCLTIDQIRSKSAGTLIETSGTISVPVGIVSNNVLYLQDQSGGIQIYLSTSKGKLPSDKNKVATITGEVSSSSTKRILLDDLTDLTVGNSSTVKIDQISSEQASGYLGWLVKVKGGIASLENDQLSLTNPIEALKVHFESLVNNLKDNYRLDDQVNLTAVVDYNSASSKVEAWATDDQIDLINRSASTPVAGSPVKKTTSVSKTAQKTVSQTDSNPPKAIMASINNQNSQVDATKTASGTNIPISNSQIFLLTFGSFIAGLIGMRGKRFQKINLPR